MILSVEDDCPVESEQDMDDNIDKASAEEPDSSDMCPSSSTTQLMEDSGGDINGCQSTGISSVSSLTPGDRKRQLALSSKILRAA